MTTYADTEAAGWQGLYWTLCLALGVMTLGEWLFYARAAAWGVGLQAVVPTLLTVSALKFALVVAWFSRRGSDAGWGKKALMVAFVMGGGTTAVLIRLLAG